MAWGRIGTLTRPTSRIVSTCSEPGSWPLGRAGTWIGNPLAVVYPSFRKKHTNSTFNNGKRPHAVLPRRTPHNPEPAKAAGNHTSKSVAPRVWTREEDARLLGLVNELGPDWEVLAIYYQCQDPAEIQARYADLTRKLVYPTWQPEDVFQLRTAIAQYGTEAWEVVAKQVGLQKLTVKDCYEYWYHHLDGAEPPGQWPMSQDVMLLLCTYDGHRHILKRMPTYRNLCNHYRTREPTTLINRRDNLSRKFVPMPAAAYTAFGQYFWHTVASVLATTNGKAYHPKHCRRRLQWLETALEFTLSLPPPTVREFFELTKTRKRVSLDDTETIGLEVSQEQLSMLVRTVGLTHYFSRMVLKAGRGSS